MKFSRYLSLYNVQPCPLPLKDACTFEDIYNAAKRYLPTLPPANEVIYESFKAHRPGVLGYVRKPESGGGMELTERLPAYLMFKMKEAIPRILEEVTA